MFTVAAELAFAATDARREGDAVAGFEPGHVLTDFHDFARPVAAGDVRHIEVDAGESAARPHVQVVQRARLDVDENLVPVGFRVREFVVLDNLRPAVLGELDGFHAWHVGREH